VLPLAIFLGLDADPGHYRVGHFAVLAGRLGGPWMALGFNVSAWICQLGTCNAMAITADRTLAHLMDLRLDWIGISSGGGGGGGGSISCSLSWCSAWATGLREDTGIRPVYTLVNSGIVVLLSVLPLKPLVSSEVLLFSVASLTILAAFLHLKIRRPGLSRPFAVPGGVPGSCVLVSFPAAVTVLQIALNVFEARDNGEGRARLAGIACIVVVGVMAQKIVARCRRDHSHREV